jgi:hypothetical protein
VLDILCEASLWDAVGHSESGLMRGPAIRYSADSVMRDPYSLGRWGGSGRRLWDGPATGK